VSCENFVGVGERVELKLNVCARKPRIMVQLMRFSVILRLSSRRHWTLKYVLNKVRLGHKVYVKRY
jgi:hypothetical protein